nr:hypothetical protein GCM10020092_090730 [Actinoplanes digitatis]
MPAVGGETQPIIRIVELLPSAVGAEEAERLAALHVDVDAVDRGEPVEAFDQPPGVNECHPADPSERVRQNYAGGVFASRAESTSWSVTSTIGSASTAVLAS